ncbi:YihY/virulence factor BrkB family protein [Cellulosimicrobium marinum]|uniref:YihY/virulence factor BrkB family protein n=1 Tax=Cellulosimicrobium marinum TaxID=1638992 RepID=UPI001E3EBEF6|nr:YihY/virulence factor BrkB family protein [Cellulosimicrobium marinum]MCB7136501.1 YihY/virulence factor BrkB family protein [Cellulosimicrobium marinum]
MTSTAPSGPSGVRRLAAKGRDLGEWWKDSRPGRAVYRYLYARGALLCGGIAYSALFSLFAALTIGYTVFMQVLGGREELMDAVFEQINELIPGLIDTGKGGVLAPEDLLLDSGSTLTSVVAGLVLLFSAVSFMYHLRGAIRTMFGASDVGQSPVLARLRGLVGFVLLALSIVVSTAAGIVVTTVGTRALDALGITGGAAVLVTTAGLVVSVLVDAVVVALVVVFLGGVDVKRTDLLVGSLVAGLAFGVLRYLGTSIVASSAQRNALLASFAVLVTLLLLVNFLARVLLVVCAWMADPPREREPEPGGPRHARDGRPELPVVDGPRTGQGRHARGAIQDRGATADGAGGAPSSREEHVRAGHGRGRPWSPVVRGVRRGRLPRDA